MTKIDELLVQSAVMGGANPRRLEELGYSYYSPDELPGFDELKRKVIQHLTDVESPTELEILLDPSVWYSLPWEIGLAALGRMFELGRRDPEFLGVYSSFINYYSDPIEERDLKEPIRAKLNKEGRSELAEIMRPKKAND